MKKTYRLLAGVILLALFAPILAGCSDDPLAGVSPKGQHITFWYQYRDDKEKAMLDLIDQFNQTNPYGITVSGQFVGSYAEIYNRIQKCIAAKTCPDISVAYQNQAAMYAKLNALIELTPYEESALWGFPKQVLNTDFFPFVWQADYLPQFKGRYGFATQRSMEVLYYNEDWLKALGYSGAPPATWDEFAEMACKATDPQSGTVGYEMAIDASTFADMVFNRGGSMVNDKATEYTFGDKAGLDVLAGLQQLFQQGCAILEKGSDDDQTDFSNRRVLFIISSTASLPVVRNGVNGAFQWSVSTLPTTLPKARVNVYGASLSVFRSTPEKQLAAWLFIKWLAEPEQGEAWTRATDYFPVRQTTKDRLTTYFAENPQFAEAWGFLGNEVAIEPGVVGYDQCRDLILEMMTAAIGGEDPAVRLANTVKRCNKLLTDGAP